MPMTWKPGGGFEQTAFKQFTLKDGSIIAVFQGARGQRPDLDIVVKYRDKHTKTIRPRTPQHIHWVIDLIIKREHNRALTMEFVRYLVKCYDEIEPFADKQDQQHCALRFCGEESLRPFAELDQYGDYSVEFLAHVMELFGIEEKTGFAGAFMFKAVLNAFLNDKDIFSIAATASHNGR
jgi:hypothetical protein